MKIKPVENLYFGAHLPQRSVPSGLVTKQLDGTIISKDGDVLELGHSELRVEQTYHRQVERARLEH